MDILFEAEVIMLQRVYFFRVLEVAIRIRSTMTMMGTIGRLFRIQIIQMRGRLILIQDTTLRRVMSAVLGGLFALFKGSIDNKHL
jgi:hypothetical protein